MSTVRAALQEAVEVVRDGQHRDLDSAVAAGIVAFLRHNGAMSLETLKLAAAVARVAGKPRA